MATKHKADVQAGLKDFNSILARESDYVPAILGKRAACFVCCTQTVTQISSGLATAHANLKQLPKARRALKRIESMQYNAEEADAFERSYLLLADLYINVRALGLVFTHASLRLCRATSTTSLLRC